MGKNANRVIFALQGFVFRGLGVPTLLVKIGKNIELSGLNML